MRIVRTFCHSYGRNLGCHLLFLAIRNGNSSVNNCHDVRSLGVLAVMTEWLWKAFSGFLRRELDGAIFLSNIPVPRRAGVDFETGKKKEFGFDSGEPFSLGWMSKKLWTGARRLSTGVLLLPKKGALCGKDQAGQRHKVDGGGRRQGYSYGKPTYLGIARGGNSVRKHSPASQNPSPRTRQTTLPPPAFDRRSCL